MPLHKPEMVQDVFSQTVCLMTIGDDILLDAWSTNLHETVHIILHVTGIHLT